MKNVLNVLSVRTFGIIAIVALIIFSTIACSKKAVAQESSKTESVKSEDKEAPESDFTVKLTSDNAGVIIVKYNGTAATVRIPTTIQGLPVREIGSSAFVNGKEKNITLKSVTISEGVKSIGNSTFYNCEMLSSVSLPSTLVNIEELAFCDCSSITSIDLPTGLTKIGQRAFSGTGLTLFPNPWPKAITTISDNLFEFTKMNTVVIPEGVTKIGEEAFLRCKELTSITFPSTISSLGGRAFVGCSSLTIVNIPESVTKINFEGNFHFRESSKVNLASQARLKQVGYNGDF